MVKRSIFFLLLLSPVFIFCQSSTGIRLSVPVKNILGENIEGITAELKRINDSGTVKIEISEKGEVQFDNVFPGTYIIKLSSIQYHSIYLDSFTVLGENIFFPTITLVAKEAEQLKDVTVTTKKPFVQKLVDRLVINVENSIVNAGSTAMEVLERSPGVLLDQNDNISLRGKAGVIIMIDGKVSALSGSDLANYLKGLSSNAIDRIEIITNPSSKYDAAGNSGIIDIKMKKDIRLGYNGTLTAGYGQGVYPKANAGTTFNYRNKKVNIFGNYNYGFRKGLNHLLLERNFYENGYFISGDLKDNYMVFPNNNHTARAGADFFPGKNTVIGFVVNSSFNSSNRVTDNSSIVLNSLKNPSTTFNTDARSHDKFNNIVFNINYKQTLGKNNMELSSDADYGVFNNSSLSKTTTQYFQLNGNTLKPTYILAGDQDGKLTIKTAKLDFTSPVKTKIKLEMGLKASVVSANNDAKFNDVSSGIPVNDVTKTNHFLYEEGNNAGYINLVKEFKKYSIQVGLRGEQTNIKTHQAMGNVAWDSSYFQLFPTFFFNYKLKEEQSIGLSVSRRIDRPGYNQLNPFLFLIDVSTYTTGAPGLLPQITWSFETNYTIKNINVSGSYSHTKNVQTIVLIPFKTVFPNIPVTDTNVTVQIPVNLTSSDYYGISISAPVRVNKWWNMVNNLDVFYNHFKGDLSNTTLNNGTPAASLSINNTFTFSKGWSSELGFRYNSRQRSGYMVMEPQWGLSAGVQKSLLKNKGTIRLNVTDIFWTNLPKATITYNNYIENWHAFRETRVANLTFTYRFGNNKVAGARKRSTASEEERRRAGG